MRVWWGREAENGSRAESAQSDRRGREKQKGGVIRGDREAGQEGNIAQVIGGGERNVEKIWPRIDNT